MNLKALADGVGVADVVDAMMMTHAHRTHVIDLFGPDPSRVLIDPAATIGFLSVRKDFMDDEDILSLDNDIHMMLMKEMRSVDCKALLGGA